MGRNSSVKDCWYAICLCQYDTMLRRRIHYLAGNNFVYHRLVIIRIHADNHLARNIFPHIVFCGVLRNNHVIMRLLNILRLINQGHQYSWIAIDFRTLMTQF